MGTIEQLEEPPPHYSERRIVTQHKYVNNIIKEEDFLAVTAKYPFVATPYYLSLAEGTIDDPIMQQLCPTTEELVDYDEVVDDPLAEERDSPVQGLVHRYPDRVLMVVTNVCFMNCRHCMRKRLWQKGRFVYSAEAIDKMINRGWKID